MIIKDLLSENGYTFQDPVTAQEIQDLFKPMLHEFKCMIINKKTCDKYGIQAGGKFISINNNVPDGMFYINRMK